MSAAVPTRLSTSVDKINYLITKHCGTSRDELRAIGAHVHARLKQLRDDKTRAMIAMLVPGQGVVLSQTMKKVHMRGAHGVIVKVNRTRVKVQMADTDKIYTIPATCVNIVTGMSFVE